MISSQVLAKGNDSATLHPDRLIISQEGGRVRKEIPLVAVHRAGRDGETGIRVHLTDGEVHWIPGGNATATEAFLDALSAALPEERDPAGSALVTVEEKEPFRAWVWWTGGITVLLAYVGYVTWVGGTHGIGHAVLTSVSLFGAVLGLLGAVGAVSSFLDGRTLARRGITVVATRGRYPNGKRHGYFTYTDPSGNEYTNHSSRSSETVHLVYDPESPGSSRVRQTFAWMTVKHVLGLGTALGLLWLGALGVAAPFR
ncbi:hypothetical protein [Streptomyces sp. NPDC058664]|uniref:hypothetical protein n=1 Tax=unclassified Streptomyces TaxID=2593676 RepID=UPI00366A1878